MSDALENKAVEILDKSQQAIAGFADRLGDLAKQYGPDVADAALQMARVDAISGLVAPILLFAVLAVSGWLALPRLWKLTREKEAFYKEKGSWSQGDPTAFFVVVAALWSVCGAVALYLVLDVWRWVGIFEPKLWLAKRILGL